MIIDNSDSGSILYPGFKVILLGDEAVGKTSLFYRYVHNKFENSYRQTLGTEILLKEVTINGVTIILQIWDVAGGKYFSRYREKFYNGASGAVIVFDMTRQKTYDNIKSWREEFENIVVEVPAYIFVGNKSDLDGAREIHDADNEKYRYKYPFELTSAKTGENVENTFKRLAEILYKKKTGLEP